MFDKDWFDDFMKYKMVTESDDDSGNTGGGNNPGCFRYLLSGVIVLYLISKLFA